jgi:hypothetical protein
MTPALDPGNKQHGTPSPSREFVQPCVLPWESRRPWRRSSTSCSIPFGSPRPPPPSLSPSPRTLSRFTPDSSTSSSEALQLKSRLFQRTSKSSRAARHPSTNRPNPRLGSALSQLVCLPGCLRCCVLLLAKPPRKAGSISAYDAACISRCLSLRLLYARQAPRPSPNLPPALTHFARCSHNRCPLNTSSLVLPADRFLAWR